MLLLAWCSIGQIAEATEAKVKLIQNALLLTGYDPGPLDGLWGGQTYSALDTVLKNTSIKKSLTDPNELNSDILLN